MGKIGKILLVIIGLLLLFGLMRGCSVYNKLVKLDEGVQSQWGNVEAQYQRRMDLINSVIGQIKGSTAFERGTLTDVVEARAKATQMTIDPSKLTEENLKKFQAAQDQLSGSLSRLMMTIERYPDLKTTQQFQDLQAQLEGTENRISNERTKFNEMAKEFNTYQRRFPQVIFARMFGFEKVGYFGAQAGAESGVNVDFSEPKPEGE